MELETMIMAGQLDHGMQYLDPIPDRAKKALAELLVHDVRLLTSKGTGDAEATRRLAWMWLQRGRSYERGNHICEGSFGKREETYV